MIRDKIGYVEGYEQTVDDYPVASNEMLLKSPNLGFTNKQKKISFAEEFANRKKNIPGPGRLDQANWNKMKFE